MNRRLTLHRRSRSMRRTGFERLESRCMLASDMVVVWNNALMDAIRNESNKVGPTWASRSGAIVHAAVFDAVNAIDRSYTSYVADIVGDPSGSKEAAAAVAAHDTLVALYPLQAAKFDTLLNQSLLGIPNGPAEDEGVRVGGLVAQQILEVRANDGAKITPYTPSSLPGRWRPDPTISPTQSALGYKWGDVQTFTINSTDDFAVPSPPALESAAYTAAFNEVKSLGAKNSTTRTADQTEIGIFWGYDRGGLGPPTNLYNQNVQAIAAAKGNSLVQNARLFALVNLAMADTGITVWDTKYDYDLWRPITAIREAETDGNSDTIADPTWVPLGAPGGGVVPDFTPPFPAYTSGHAGFGAAVFRTLANFYGTDNFNYSLTSEELPGVVRRFTSFSQAAQENGVSRIYLGIHWNFDNTMGQQQGRGVADYVFRNFLKPRPATRGVVIGLSNGSQLEAALPNSGVEIALKRTADRLEVINKADGSIVLGAGLSAIRWVQVGVQGGGTDSVIIDFSSGRFNFTGGVTIYGTPIDDDRLKVIGTNSAEAYSSVGHILTASGLAVDLHDVFNVLIDARGGNDSFAYNGGTARRLYPSISFDGATGRDTAVFRGSGADDRSDLSPSSGSLRSLAYSTFAYGTESIRVEGGAGHDTAVLRDSAAIDRYYAHPNSALLRAADGSFSNSVEKFERIEAYSSAGGRDLAYLYDSSGDDRLTAHPNAVLFENSAGGFANYVEHFERVEAFARQGGNDMATLYDSPGDDVLNAQPNAALLTGPNGAFANYVETFDRVETYGRAGGHDVAALYDSVGDERVHMHPRAVLLINELLGFSNYVETFDRVEAYARRGGHDRAYMYDSAANERLSIHPTAALLEDETRSYSNYAELFDRVEAYARNGGYDVAEVFDSAGNDSLNATPTAALLQGTGYANYVEAFERVNAHSIYGGFDEALFFDSDGDDIVENAPGYSVVRATNSAYYNLAANFDNYQVFANRLGHDHAFLLDLQSVDFVMGRGNWLGLQRIGSRLDAYGLTLVKAFARPNQSPQSDLKFLDYVFERVGW